MTTWPELVEQIRKEHNGVFAVVLFFGHDGHNRCSFSDYETTLAIGESGRSMQEAVERCLLAWHLELEAQSFAKMPEVKI